ncbi:MAG: transcriptional regulator [Verrucomicrobiales bacterium]
MIDFSQLDPVIHEKGRLAIVSLLASRAHAWPFSELRDELGQSDGNLITHLRTLENAGYVSHDKVSGSGRPRTSYTLTAEGKSAFQAYLELLAQLVASQAPGKKRSKV